MELYYKFKIGISMQNAYEIRSYERRKNGKDYVWQLQ